MALKMCSGGAAGSSNPSRYRKLQNRSSAATQVVCCATLIMGMKSFISWLDLNGIRPNGSSANCAKATNSPPKAPTLYTWRKQ